MNKLTNDLAATYDQYYRQPNYFHYRGWLFRPLIKAMIQKAALKRGSTVLDVGCGQGFFSAMFASEGLVTLGIDLSPEGINSAEKNHGNDSLKFAVADLRTFAPDNQYDCVFTRSCSLYNIPNFAYDREMTETLLRHVRPGGVLIFDYYSKMRKQKKSSAWRYHSLNEARSHFRAYENSEVFFTARLAPIIFGRFGLSRFFSFVDSQLSKISGIGGELIAIVRRN